MNVQRDHAACRGGRASPNAPAVSLTAAEISIGDQCILSDVTMTVGPGEFVAVLGPNGAGKSTLMRALLGLVQLTAGSARVLGASPHQARSRVGYLPQRHSFDRSTRLRGVDLVQLGVDGDRWGIPIAVRPAARARRRAEHARVREMIELVGATQYSERAIGELSGGEQQRLLIAQALVRDPELLILDEPLDSLDLPNQAAMAALVRRICTDRYVTALLVAHDVNPLLGYLDRVIYLGGGRAVSGSVEQVITAASLTRLYGTAIEVLRARDGRLVVVGQPEAPHHHGHRHD
ncbi:MAG: metal ABC transporter ATP-binding protein [Solirubrobacteraceae bacterium]